MEVNNVKTIKNRRSFLRGSIAAGVSGAGVSILGERSAFANDNSRLTKGDTAVLRFVAAAELIETDLWR
jgi:hypothetical protein